jgi:hypothetical protein
MSRYTRKTDKDTKPQDQSIGTGRFLYFALDLSLPLSCQMLLEVFCFNEAPVFPY